MMQLSPIYLWTLEWQNGKPWMILPRSQMPLRTIKEVDLSSEEKRIASQELRDSVLYNDLPEMIPRVSERYSSPIIYTIQINFLVFSCESFVLVLRACKPSWSPPGFPPPAPIDPITCIYPFLRSYRPHLSDMDLRRSENYFFYKASLEVIKPHETSTAQKCI